MASCRPPCGRCGIWHRRIRWLTSVNFAYFSKLLEDWKAYHHWARTKGRHRNSLWILWQRQHRSLVTWHRCYAWMSGHTESDIYLSSVRVRVKTLTLTIVYNTITFRTLFIQGKQDVQIGESRSYRHKSMRYVFQCAEALMFFDLLPECMDSLLVNRMG